MTNQERFIIKHIREGQLTLNELQLAFFHRYGRWILRKDIFHIYLRFMSTPIFLFKRKQGKLYLRQL